MRIIIRYSKWFAEGRHIMRISHLFNIDDPDGEMNSASPVTIYIDGLPTAEIKKGQIYHKSPFMLRNDREMEIQFSCASSNLSNVTIELFASLAEPPIIIPLNIDWQRVVVKSLVQCAVIIGISIIVCAIIWFIAK